MVLTYESLGRLDSNQRREPSARVSEEVWLWSLSHKSLLGYWRVVEHTQGGLVESVIQDAPTAGSLSKADPILA